jgi:hypothetical protein
MLYSIHVNTRAGILIGFLLLFFSPALVAQQVSQPPPAPPGAWQVIGSMQASFRVDHDFILVKGPFDNFRAIKLKVSGAALQVHHLIVTFDNGGTDRIEVRERIRQGGESRVIDLKGVGKRSIRRIDVWYDTQSLRRGKARLTVFGMK